MGALSSAQRDGKQDEDTVTETSAGQEESQDDRAEMLLQKNGQISNLNGKTENQADELKCPCEERVLAEGSGPVTMIEDSTETTDHLQEQDASQVDTEELAKEMFNEDGEVVKKEDEVNNKQNDIEVGFKKIFRFVGFKFTLKKDQTEAEEPMINEQNKTAAIPSQDSRETTADSSVSTNGQDAEVMQKDIPKGDVQAEPKDGTISPETDNEISRISEITEHSEETTPDKGQVEELTQSPESEETMSPIKRFFTQGIFASLRKKRKEEAAPKENNEEDLKRTDKAAGETIGEDAERDSSCVCLDISNTSPKEAKDLQTGGRDESACGGEVMNSQEKDKVQASPLKRLFRKLSTRRQRDTTETNITEPGENLKEKLQLSTELIKVQKEQEEAKMEEPKPVDEDQVMDISPESKKKSDSAVSWDSLICIGSNKKRARKIPDSEDAMQDKGEVPRKTSESPLGSSTEGEYDNLTSSNEHAGSAAEDESGSTWKSLKKLVTPKRKSRMEESGSSEQILSDTEITKDESSCSIKKLIPGRKKRKSDGRQERSSSDEAGKGTETDNEDDETPGIVPLSEYENNEPENLKEMTYIPEIAKEMQQMAEEDKPKELKPSVKYSYNVEPPVVPIPSDYMEELTEFLSKHLSDIPEEGNIEESIATPVSSAEWTTQDDTLAEDIVELTADAVTAPEPATEHFNGDETTEMVSAVSQLTESPKTSGNVTPVRAEYDIRETDVILQEAVESICMNPSIMSVSTKDTDPEALLISVSPCILESTIAAETKVLVAHEKTEATSFCIGLVSQEFGDAKEVLPVNLVEGISEITEAVPTELVSEEMSEDLELAGLDTEDVHKAEVKEITDLHEEFLFDEPNTPVAEMEKEMDQASEIHVDVKESSKSEVSLVVETEEMKECPPEAHDNQELLPVQMASSGESHFVEKQVITDDANEVSDTEGPLEITLEKHVHEQPELYTDTTVEREKECILPDVTLSATDIEHITLAEAPETGLQNAMDSVPDTTINEASVIPVDVVHINLAEVVETPGPGTAMASEVTEGVPEVLASAVECPAITEAVNIVSPVTDSNKVMTAELKHEVQMENVPSLHFESHETQVELEDNELKTAKANVETIVLDVATASNVGDIYEKAEEIREVVATPQKIESITAEESGENCAEEIFHKVENVLECIDHFPGKENYFNKEVNETSLSVTANIDECRSAEEPEDESEIMVALKEEHRESDISSIEDYKIKGTGGTETFTEAEKQGENVQAPVISEQTGLQEEFGEEQRKPLNVEGVQPENQMAELSLDAPNAEVAPEPVEETALTEAGGTCPEDDALISEDMLKHEETAESEIIAKEPKDTIEAVAPSQKDEPEDVRELQIETVTSKPDESQVTESSLQLSKEDHEIAEDSVNVIKTVSDMTVINVEGEKQSMVVSSTDVEFDQTCKERTTDHSEGKGFEISEQPMGTVQHLEATLGEPRITVTTVEAAKVELFAVKQKSEDLVTPATEVDETVVEVTKIIHKFREVVHEEKTEIKAGSEQTAEYVCVTEVTALQGEKVEISETDTETLTVLGQKEETTEMISEVEKTISEALAIEQKMEPPVVTENETETLSVIQHEMQTVVMTQLKAGALEVMEPEVETHAVTEVKLETALVTELDVETSVVAAVVTELEVETPVVTSIADTLDANTNVMVSEIKDANVHPVLKVQEPVEITGTTVGEMPPTEEKLVVGPEILTVTVVPELQTPVSKVAEMLPEVFKEKDTNVKIPVAFEVAEPKLEIPAAAEAIIQTVSELEAQKPVVASVLETETLVETSVENNDVQSLVATSVKKHAEMETPILTSTINEPQLKTPVIPEVETQVNVPVLQTLTVISTVQLPAVVSLVKEPEVPVATLEIKETPDTADALEITAPVRVETTEQTAGVEIKSSSVTSVVMEFEASPLKNIEASIIEEPAGTSVIYPPTAASVVQTPAVDETPMVIPDDESTVMLIPTVVSVVQPPTVVKEAEVPRVVPDVKERKQETKDMEASVAVEVEIKSPCTTDTELKEANEEVAGNIESATEPKVNTESLETISKPKEPVVSIAKTVEPLPDMEDDVWEDAVDVIKDEESSITRADELKNTSK